MFNGLKMSNFKNRSHVQEIILIKNMFGCPSKHIFKKFGIFCVFGCKPFNIHTQLCMNVKTHHHHMNYFKLNYSIFSLKFVSNKYYLQKVAP
jgi:hypothetical protein